ncbi:MAG: sugar phosphate nucleotidyltransferase [Halobaculum sp.]
MDAVVPAAGRGTRMGDATADRPKPLVEVAGEPLLSHAMRPAVAAGVEELVVVVGYRGDQIVDRYGDSFEGVPITYAWQEDPRGLADGVRIGGSRAAGAFLQVHGDYVFGGSFDGLLARHRASDAAATLLVEGVPPERASEFGVIEFEADGSVAGVVEKPADPPSNVVLTGAFVFDPVVVSACEVITPSDRGEYETADALDLLVTAGHEIELVAADAWLVNVNSPADAATVERRLNEG